jgi:tRNA (cytidine/uridine-2'-O-)-methyltransferase
MLAGRRSLNLSNAAAIAAYEAWRQNGFDGAAGPATSDTGAV